MRTLQLYGTGSSTASAVAQIVIPSSSTLLGIAVHVRYDTVTDNAVCVNELSKASASQIGVNGAQDAFLTLGVANNLLTSGMTLTGINQFFPLRISFRQGEICYLHATVSNCSYFFSAILHLSA